MQNCTKNCIITPICVKGGSLRKVSNVKRLELCRIAEFHDRAVKEGVTKLFNNFHYS